MRRIQQQKGFTLVELAIVLVIIGLLIGGILKGQQLMRNAQVTATIQQVKAIEAGANTFYDSRGYYPGDADGTGQIPGCGPTDCVVPVGTAHNGIIGPAAWPLIVSPTAITAGTEAYETVLFFYDMAATNLLSAIDGTAPSTTLLFGKTHPAAKTGTGGFIVGNSNGIQPGNRGGGGTGVTINGTILSLVVSPTSVTGIDSPGTPGSMPLDPARAGQMDRKMDDGRAAGGAVQAWGVSGATGCTDGAFATTSNYNEGNTSKDCGLYIGITQ
ncbi:MAG: prepilin-type N-terminal cleavage/methylation domain-containing protein [Alphaproteobacteria bacterium]|nr:prepilin-type N-terminal cleavage/methylation domain-containing protein [Alphaproteobacteria bacterium]